MVKVDKLPSGSYRARVNIGFGKYKTFTAKTKKEVQLKAFQFEADFESSSSQNSYAALTVAEAVEKYIESKKNILSPTTYKGYKSLQENIFPSLVEVKLCDLNQEQIQIAVNIAAAELSPKTVRNMHGLLSSTLKMFVPSFMLNTTLPQRKKSDVVIPTEEDMISLFNATRDTDMEIPILLAAVCGLRRSEIAGLKWSAVDFKKSALKIEGALVENCEKELILKGTKSSAGYRTIKLQSNVLKALKRHQTPEAEFVTSLTPTAIYKHYKKFLKKACPGKDYTFHELRHYAASVMIMLGIPTKYIADYLGHETVDMVNRVYGHIMSDKKDLIFSGLENYYCGVFSKCDF